MHPAKFENNLPQILRKHMLNHPALVCYRVMIDKLLIMGVRRGQREALRRIYERYHQDLLKLAVVLTGDMNAAEDVVQDVFCSMGRTGERLSLTGSLKGFLVTCTVNRIRQFAGSFAAVGKRHLAGPGPHHNEQDHLPQDSAG